MITSTTIILFHSGINTCLVYGVRCTLSGSYPHAHSHALLLVFIIAALLTPLALLLVVVLAAVLAAAAVAHGDEPVQADVLRGAAVPQGEAQRIDTAANTAIWGRRFVRRLLV